MNQIESLCYDRTGQLCRVKEVIKKHNQLRMQTDSEEGVIEGLPVDHTYMRIWYGLRHGIITELASLGFQKEIRDIENLYE